MLIHVTIDDIAKGKPLDECNCPIALALKRQLNQEWITVTDDGFYIMASMKQFIYFKDEYYTNISCFIHHFDHDIPVAPFSFEIPEIPACN